VLVEAVHGALRLRRGPTTTTDNWHCCTASASPFFVLAGTDPSALAHGHRRQQLHHILDQYGHHQIVFATTVAQRQPRTLWNNPCPNNVHGNLYVTLLVAPPAEGSGGQRIRLRITNIPACRTFKHSTHVHLTLKTSRHEHKL
jgi:hypothetical protein